ncbi:DNA alkylation repair protein [Patescibacteria group bacterium]|nr:DNA alkylation repair protein [Patescibacteria group bacterium]
MDKMIVQIRQELDEIAKNQKYRKDHTRFFKEKVKTRNIESARIRKLAKEYFDIVRGDRDKEEIFDLSEELLLSGYNEEATIAFDWAYRLKNDYQEEDFVVFEKWLEKYIDNWGKCDDFCTHAFGYLLTQYPDKVGYTNKWVKSKNRWLRRAAAVIYIFPNRKDKLIKNAFNIARTLLQDEDDLVRKGYGWMLKEISKLYPERVFDFVMKNKAKMPRTALRYAIEKLPTEKKKMAMVK